MASFVLGPEDLPYIQGLADGDVEDAQALFDDLKKHGWLECEIEE